MVRLCRELIGSYGSFLFFPRLLPNLLLVACTLVQPWTGMLGLIAGGSTLLTRRLLVLPPVGGGMDIVNGILSGLFVGVVFLPDWRGVLIAGFAGPLTVLVASWLAEILWLKRLPMLSGAFVFTGLGLFALGRALALPYAVYGAGGMATGLPWFLQDYLVSLGSIYLTPFVLGGVPVLAAIMVSSRTLAFLSLFGFTLSRLVLLPLQVPSNGMAGIAAGSAAMLTAIMVGGIFVRPGLRAIVIAGFGAVCATLICLIFFNLFWYVALVPLSLPYLATTWLIMIALRPERGGPWGRYWLPAPALPEQIFYSGRQAESRGLSPVSVALRAPFSGRWHVYQGFGGPHTHLSPRQHAVDFHRILGERAFTGEGLQAEDYHCFSQPVLSPVHGWVGACRADLPDNRPGEVDVTHCWGNFVLIAVDSGPFVLLAHLRQGSVTVVPGTRVHPGQPLAQCGNSGRSPQPHLHVHVQIGAALGGATVPFHFSNVCIEHAGQRHYALDGVPVEGDTVMTPPPNTTLKLGMQWQVGTTLSYRVTEPGKSPATRRIAIGLEPDGTFQLRGEGDARVAFVDTGDLHAHFNRRGGNDPFLDAFSLAVGLTPYIEIDAVWYDALPPRLLPRSLPVQCAQWLLPFLFRTESRFHREWDPELQVWRQIGLHAVNIYNKTLWSCRTIGLIAEGGGIIGIILERSGTVALKAEMISVSMNADHGVPGWTYTIQGQH